MTMSVPTSLFCRFSKLGKHTFSKRHFSVFLASSSCHFGFADENWRQEINLARPNFTAGNVLTEDYKHSLRPRCHQLQAYIQRRLYSEDSESFKSDVSYEELLALLESDDVQLFDVREPKEIKETGTIPGSTNIPLTKVKEALSMNDASFAESYGVPFPDKHDRNIIFYGLGPIKSTAALELAYKLGYKKARHYPGGWEEWSDRNTTQ